MQPSEDKRRSFWPTLERFAAGEPTPLDEHPSSVTVCRRRLKADAEEQESSHHWTPHETMPKDEAEDSESDAEIGALQKSVVEFVEPSIGGPRMSHEISFSLAAEAEPDAADSEVKYKLQIVRRAPYIPKEAGGCDCGVKSQKTCQMFDNI